MMQQIAILGCGWLGHPLAQTMVAKGMTVKGSTTSEDKLKALATEGIDPYLITLNEDGVHGAIAEFLEHADLLIIDIPPKAKTGEDFVQKIRALVPHIEAAGISKVLFVSSTSVYGDVESVVTEDTLPVPDTESGRQLLETEKLLQKNTKFETAILRFGGLTGGDRHPVKHLAGRQNLAHPDAPINLIHRDDCIGIILSVIEQNVWGEVFNAVTPYHPTRRAFYTQKAKEMGLGLPLFNESGIGGKIVNSNNVVQKLGYSYRITDSI